MKTFYQMTKRNISTSGGSTSRSRWAMLFETIMFSLLINIFFTFLGLSQSPICDSQTSPWRYINDYPHLGTPSWGDDDGITNGIAHDADYWYITALGTTDEIDLFWGDLPGQPNGDWIIWKIPVSRALDHDFSGEVQYTRQSHVPPGMFPTSYGHAGDLDYFNHNGTGYIIVPFTGGPVPVVAFFRTADLVFVNYAILTNQYTVGWCAVNAAGELYTSEDEATTFLRYQIDWTRLTDTTRHDALTSLGKHDFAGVADASGGQLGTLHNMQGGEFTPNGKLLYISCGVLDHPWGDNEFSTDGIHVFDTEPETWQEIQHSINGSGCFNYSFDNTFSGGDEPEGLTIWDLDDGRAPYVGGQLHALVYNHNYAPGNSNTVSLKHYSVPLEAPATIPPSITKHPVSLTAVKGYPASFSVATTGDRLKFQWVKNGTTIPGATTSTYRIPSVGNSDNGAVFRCVVSNSLGSVTSNGAVLTVLFPPWFTLNPKKSVTVPTSQSIRYEVLASGDAPISYQWQKNGVNIPGATTSTYVTPPPTLSDSGSIFRCIATNPYGSATSSGGVLRVVPRFPSTSMIMNGGFENSISDWTSSGARFDTMTPGYEGNNTARIELHHGKDGSEISQEDFGLDANTAYRLSITARTSLSFDTISISVTNDAAPFVEYWGTVKLPITQEWHTFDTVLMTKNFEGMISDARLTVKFKRQQIDGVLVDLDNVEFVRVESKSPIITEQPANQTLVDGLWTTFSIGASGDPPLTYRWLKNGFPIDGGNGPSVTIPQVVMADSGARVRCIVSNGFGRTSSKPALLNVVSGNLVQNHDFELGKTDWVISDTVAGFFQLTGPGYSGLSAASVQIKGTTSNLHLSQFGIGLESGVAIRIHFAAKSDHDRDTMIVSLVSGSSPSVSYWGPFRFTLPRDQWQIFDTVLVTKNFTGTVGDAVLNFAFLGGAGPHFYLDDVHCEHVDKRVPVVFDQPADQKIFEGSSATFTVGAVGLDPLKFQWLKNEVPIAGESGSSVAISAPDGSDNGAKIRCIVSNAYGKTSSRSATLKVIGNLVTNPGFELGTTGWKPSDSLAAQLTLYSPGYAGKYAMKIEVKALNVNTSLDQHGLELDPYTAMEASFYAKTDQNVDSVTVSLTQDSSGGKTFMGPVTFILGKNWQKYTIVLATRNFSEANTIAKLSFQFCGSCGHRFYYIDEVTVKRARNITMPIVTRHPSDQIARVGQTATFTIQSTGEEPLAYQWQKNGVNISGAVSPTYTTPATSLADSGVNFRCLVSNAYGMAASNQAILTVVTTIGTNTSQQIAIRSEWNLVSVPIIMSDFSKSTIFPSATSNAFAYEGGYVTNGTLHSGHGYWLRFPSNETVVLSGELLLRDTIEVRQGWNLIGSISYPVSVMSVASEPAGLIVSNFFAFTGNGYTLADTIKPGCGYWVRVDSAGKLILSPDGMGVMNLAKIARTDEVPPPPPPKGGTVGRVGDEIPVEYSLAQNFPNPFNPTTTVSYDIPTDSKVRITVYNVLGNTIATLVDGVVRSGRQFVTWNSEGIASGVYFYRLEATSIDDQTKSITQVKKMLLVR